MNKTTTKKLRKSNYNRMIKEVAEIGKNGTPAKFFNMNKKQIMEFNPAKNSWRKIKKEYLRGG